MLRQPEKNGQILMKITPPPGLNIKTMPIFWVLPKQGISGERKLIFRSLTKTMMTCFPTVNKGLGMPQIIFIVLFYASCKSGCKN